MFSAWTKKRLHAIATGRTSPLWLGLAHSSIGGSPWDEDSKTTLRRGRLTCKTRCAADAAGADTVGWIRCGPTRLSVEDVREIAAILAGDAFADGPPDSRRDYYADESTVSLSVSVGFGTGFSWIAPDSTTLDLAGYSALIERLRQWRGAPRFPAR